MDFSEPFCFCSFSSNICNTRAKDSLRWILVPVKIYVQTMPLFLFLLLFLCGSQLPSSLFLTFDLNLSSYPFNLCFVLFFLIHSLTKSLTLTLNLDPPLLSFTHLPPSQLVSPDSPLVFHLPSSLARSHCHWSVLASLSFSYQTDLIWLPYQGLSSDWGWPDYEGKLPLLS